jgi:hypothetical protein
MEHVEETVKLVIDQMDKLKQDASKRNQVLQALNMMYTVVTKSPDGKKKTSETIGQLALLIQTLTALHVKEMLLNEFVIL